MTRPAADLIFLIGAARSGTKFLRDVLDCSEYVSAVPFDINYVWRYRQECRTDDAIPIEAADNTTRKYVTKAITRLSEGRGKNASKILEKTVSNCFRIPYIFRMFPEAQFIHLVRDGRDVAESAARTWQAKPDWHRLLQKARSFPLRHYRYAVWFVLRGAWRAKRTGRRTAIWGPRYPGLERDLESCSMIEIAARQWEQSVRFARQGLSFVPDRQQITVRYEDLISDQAVLGDLLKFIDLPDRNAVLTAFKNNVRTDLGGKWRTLTSKEQAQIQHIQTEMLVAYNYELATIA